MLNVGWDAFRNRFEHVVGVEARQRVFDARASGEQLARVDGASGLLAQEVGADFGQLGLQLLLLGLCYAVSRAQGNQERKNYRRSAYRDES